MAAVKISLRWHIHVTPSKVTLYFMVHDWQYANQHNVNEKPREYQRKRA